MKADTTVTTIVTLELDTHEAMWLKALMHNPLSDPESAEDRQMRSKYWEALATPDEKIPRC